MICFWAKAHKKLIRFPGLIPIAIGTGAISRSVKEHQMML